MGNCAERFSVLHYVLVLWLYLCSRGVKLLQPCGAGLDQTYRLVQHYGYSACPGPTKAVGMHSTAL